ncbi:MAG: tetratricopeptide repeat protein, partial [Acidobacteriota bacterium]
TAFQSALRLKPADPDANLGMGNAYYNNAKYPDALPFYQNAAKYEPTWVLAHVYSGDTLRLLKRNAEAETAYLRAVQLDAKNVDSIYWLGVLYAASSRFADARVQYDRLKPLDTAKAEKLFAFLPKN